MAKKDNSVQDDIIPEKDPQEIEKILIDQANEQEEAEKKAIEEAAKPKDEEIEIDIEKLKEEAKKEAKEEIEKEVVAPIKSQLDELIKKQTPEEKSAYQKYVEDYKMAHGDTPDWEIMATFLEDRAVERVRSERLAAEKAVSEEEEAQKKAAEEQNEKNFTYWQSQLTEMESSGFIPKQVKAEKGDPGFDARVALYAAMQATWNTPTPLTNMYEVFTKNPIKRGQVEDAPILGDAGGAPGGNSDSFKYGEIHGADIEKLMFEAAKEQSNS